MFLFIVPLQAADRETHPPDSSTTNNALSCFTHETDPLPPAPVVSGTYTHNGGRLHRWDEATTSWPISASSSAIWEETETAGGTQPVGHEASTCLRCGGCCPQMNHKVPHWFGEKEETHLFSDQQATFDLLHTHFLSLTLCPLDAVSLPPQGTETLLHLATCNIYLSVSPSSGCAWDR